MDIPKLILSFVAFMMIGAGIAMLLNRIVFVKEE